MRDLEAAYQQCRRLASGHYENFPVASWLLPARMRKHVAAVYAFARTADDFADEGIRTPEERLKLLSDWRARLVSCQDGVDSDAVFAALGDTIRKFNIPVELFHDLLDAFEQDVCTREYQTFEELLDYCDRSANPVGRIMLSLFGRLSDTTGPPSDALCTGLQLANFWQDVSIDLRKPRIYLPQEDLRKFGVGPETFSSGTATREFRSLMRFQVERTRDFFSAAMPLFPLVPWRFRVELRAVWRGGMRVLDKIAAHDYNALAFRPSLNVKDITAILFSSIVPVRHP